MALAVSSRGDVSNSHLVRFKIHKVLYRVLFEIPKVQECNFQNTEGIQGTFQNTKGIQGTYQNTESIACTWQNTEGIRVLKKKIMKK